MDQGKRPIETHDQALHRLAALAEERGIAIHWHDRGPIREYYATSAGSPGLLHRVTAFSCDCAGFVRHGRCTHHSALLAAIGELPEPEPEPPAAGARVAQGPAPVTAQAAVHIEAQARAWLTSLIARERQGEVIAESDWQEATAAVALYSSLAETDQQPVALAA